MKRKTIHIRDEHADLIDEMYRQAIAEGMDINSKAEIHRQLLDVGIENADELRDLVPEDRLIMAQRDRHMHENESLMYRATFEDRVLDHLNRLLQAGVKESDLEDFRESFKEEAEILFSKDGDEKRLKEAKDHVDKSINVVQTVIEITAFDPIDPKAVFSAYESVANETEKVDTLEVLPEILSDFVSAMDDGRNALSPNDITESLARKYEVKQEHINQAVESLTGKNINRVYVEDLDEIGINQVDFEDIAGGIDSQNIALQPNNP